MVDNKLYNGAAIVQMLNPRTVHNFQEYADNVFYIICGISTRSSSESRNSLGYVHCKQLENSTREKRGKGRRRHVSSSTMILKNRRHFLRVDENKRELFQILSEQIVLLPKSEGKHKRIEYCNQSRSKELGSLHPRDSRYPSLPTCFECSAKGV